MGWAAGSTLYGAILGSLIGLVFTFFWGRNRVKTVSQLKEAKAWEQTVFRHIGEKLSMELPLENQVIPSDIRERYLQLGATGIVPLPPSQEIPRLPPAPDAEELFGSNFRRSLRPDKLRALAQKFSYQTDEDGEIVAEPGALPDPTRGHKVVFDCRLNATPDAVNALKRLGRYKDRLERTEPHPATLFIPPLDALHLALARIYPKARWSHLYDIALINDVMGNLHNRLEKEGIGLLTIRIKGCRIITDDGTIVADLEDNPLIARIRKILLEVLEESEWYMDDVTVNMRDKQPSPGGIITLGRMVPTHNGNDVAISNRALFLLAHDVASINKELQDYPLEIPVRFISVIRSNREFLAEGWENEEKIPLMPSRAALPAVSAEPAAVSHSL